MNRKAEIEITEAMEQWADEWLGHWRAGETVNGMAKAIIDSRPKPLKAGDRVAWVGQAGEPWIVEHVVGDRVWVFSSDRSDSGLVGRDEVEVVPTCICFDCERIIGEEVYFDEGEGPFCCAWCLLGEPAIKPDWYDTGSQPK